MSRFHVGVPSGVGDVYWCLTKLKALAAGRRVTLHVQHSMYDRARDWSKMVDFVTDAEIAAFTPGEAKTTGYVENRYGMDCILWPNAIIDRGERIETWLPDIPCDLNFPIKHPDMGMPRVLVYASSHSIAESWMGEVGTTFWSQVIEQINEEIGPVTLIGAGWDSKMRTRLSGDFEDLVAQTTLPELAGLISNARVVVGVISGITILANHFRTPCVALWPDYRFPESFPRAWVAPDAPYEPVKLSEAYPDVLCTAARAVARSAA